MKMGKVRFWRVLLVAALFMAIVISPIAWQKYREVRRRQATVENLKILNEALIEYERKKSAKNNGASAREGNAERIENMTEPSYEKADDARQPTH